MFSGIVEELGQVEKISGRGNIAVFEVSFNADWPEIKKGDSIAVNGVCLTVIKNAEKVLSFEVMAQTLKTTDLGSLGAGYKVNLERSLKIGDRLSGHFVTGHVDCIGIIRRKNYMNNNLCFEIAVPPDYSHYIIPQGSIAIDGISLTIAKKKGNSFGVYIIPHTLKNTTLGSKSSSDKVNLEFDLLIKGAPLNAVP